MKLKKQVFLIFCVMALLHTTVEFAYSQLAKAVIEAFQQVDWKKSLKDWQDFRLKQQQDNFRPKSQLEASELRQLVKELELQKQKQVDDTFVITDFEYNLTKEQKAERQLQWEMVKQEIREGKWRIPRTTEEIQIEMDLRRSAILMSVEDYTKAITFYEKAYSKAKSLNNKDYMTLINNQIGEAFFAIGLEAFNIDNFASATDNFNNVIKRSENNEYIAKAYFSRGLCEYNLGNLNAATNDFKQAVKYLNGIIETLSSKENLDTNSKAKFIDLLLLKADAEKYASDFGRIGTYDKILQIEANNVKAKALKGICHIQNGEIALGKDLLTSDAIQQLDNKHIQADAWYNLGLASQVNGNSEQAKAYFEIAQKLEPNKLKDQQSDLVSIHTNIGWQYYFKGDYESSIRECQKAIALAPNRPEPYYNLARAYLTKGEKAAALTEWSKGLETDKNFKVFDLAIQDLTKAVEAKRLSESDGYHGKHSFYLNKGMIEAERGEDAASKESLRGAHESKKALLSNVVEKVTFENKAGKSNYEAGSIFSEFADNPKAILQEYWMPLDVKEVKIIDSPKPALKLSNGILEIDGKIKLEEIRARFGNGTIIDEMTEIKNHLNHNDPPIAYLANEGLVISYPAKDGNILFVDLSISRLEIERITSSYNQAQERFASNGFALKKLVQKLKKKENVTEADDAGLLAPAIFLDRIQEAVGGEIDRIIVKPDKSISGINFRVIQAVQQISQQRKKPISVRVDQPQLLRALTNTRKSVQVNLQESVFLVTLPLDKETFEQSAFGKASMSRGIEWSDYEQNELKALQQEIKKLSKLIGKENVILNATRHDFLKMIEERPFVTLTLIAEHKVAENADYIEMADGLWNVRDIAKDIEPKKLPTTSVFNFITCKGKNILADMFLRKGATVVSTSTGEVELGHGLRRYVQTVEQMKKGKDFETAHDEATFKVLKETFEGKAKFSPNLKGIPIEKSDLDRKKEKEVAIDFGL